MQRARGAASDFMKRGELQPLAGKGVVDGAHAKWQDRRVGARRRSNAGDVVPKLAQKRFVPHSGPSIEFLFCSRTDSESNWGVVERSDC